MVSQSRSLLSKAPRARIPTWVDWIGLQVLIPFLMWLSPVELWTSLIAFGWLFARLYFGQPVERERMLWAMFFGLLFEVSLFRTGACLYNRPGILYVPLWIFPLWAAGGLMVCGFAASTPWAPPLEGRRLWVFLPFLCNLLLPSSWISGTMTVGVALLVSAFAWRGTEPENPGALGRALRVLAVGIGGTSASFGFGWSGVCDFPQAWYYIPPWGLALWTSITVAILGIHRR